MTWLGHQDSKMVRRYYHLHHEEAQKQMSKIKFMSTSANGEKATSAKEKGKKIEAKNIGS